jgi:hypothetical protein
MKLLFLDIDGVLCCKRPGVIQQNLTQNLASIVKKTGAFIILSTDWRRFREGRVEVGVATRLDYCVAHTQCSAVLASDACFWFVNTQVQRCLKVAGLSFVGCTPPSRNMYAAERPAEILKWLHTYRRRAEEEGLEPVTHFVAIDDRELSQELGGRYLKGHFCLTKLRQGLTAERCDAAVRMLLENPIPPDFTDQILIGHDRKVITCSRVCPAATFVCQWWRPPLLAAASGGEGGEAMMSMEGTSTPSMLPNIKPNALPHIRSGPRGQAKNGNTAQRGHEGPQNFLFGAGSATHPGVRQAHEAPVAREDSSRKLSVPHPYRTTRATAKTRFAVATTRGTRALHDASRILDGASRRS